MWVSTNNTKKHRIVAIVQEQKWVSGNAATITGNVAGEPSSNHQWSHKGPFGKRVMPGTGQPRLRQHLASPGIHPHDAAGTAATNVGADQCEVSRKGEAGDDLPGVAPVDLRVYADCQHQLLRQPLQALGGRQCRLKLPPILRPSHNGHIAQPL